MRPSKHLIAHLATLKATAEQGVDYSAKNGVPCPACGTKTKSYKTMPWDGNTRIRYHRCDNPECLLAAIKQTIKSVEVDVDVTPSTDAEAGVDYSPKNGALCPSCHRQTKHCKTMPWYENIRIRYHRCVNPDCLLATTRQTIKSVEVDRA